MANLFDADNAPTVVPEKFTAGDFVQWKNTALISDYPAGTHSVTFFARYTHGGASEFSILATTPGDYHLFTLTSAVSAPIVPGHFHWQIQVTETSSSNSLIVASGELDVLGDLDDNTTDPRTHAEVMVQKIESLLAGKADSDVSQYSIAGRQLTKMPFKDLVDARDYYRREVTVHLAKERAKQGLSTASTIKVRF